MTEEAQLREVRTADGRRLAVFVAGPEDGEAIIVHGGTPDGRPLFSANVEEGTRRGLRHISYQRPGYGGSERLPGRSVADCAGDVAAIADALEIETFFVAGASGGGPHALACAALLPARVRAAATIASVAPIDAEGLDWLDGMGDENIHEFAAMEAGPKALENFLETEAENYRSVRGEEVLHALGDLISDADRPALTGDFADHLAASIREALRNGIWGWFDDDMAFNRNWGFDLAGIEVPVAIWQGDDDRFVPPPHGRWLAENVAGAAAHLSPGEGHLSLNISSYGEILDGLLAAK
jgi:pimeloyl-ACP methyl ester carboxylesterase